MKHFNREVIFLLIFFLTGIASHAQTGSYRIVYVQWKDTISNESSIRIMNADGSNDELLVYYPGSNWMPLATPGKIWFHVDKDTLEKKKGLYLFDIEHKKETFLFSASGLYQDISFDPTTQLYAGGFSHKPPGAKKSQYDIFLFNAEGSFMKQLTNDTAIDLEPSFSPGGKQIVYRSNRDRNPGSWAEFDLYMMQLDESYLKRITNNPDRTSNAIKSSNPTWSPDGQFVSYSEWFENQYQIVLMKPDGTFKRPLLPGSDLDQSGFSFSPDGKMIAFTGRKKGARNWDIYTVKVDGTELRQLTNDRRRNVQPYFIYD
jgi:TolB protein